MFRGSANFLKSSYYDGQSGLRRQANTTYFDYTGGNLWGKWMEVFIKKDGTYQDRHVPHTDEVYYHYCVADGSAWYPWNYRDKEPTYSDSYYESNILEYAKDTSERKFTSSESTYRSLSVAFDSGTKAKISIRYMTFVGLPLPFWDSYYVNMYSQSTQNSFKNMKINRLSNGTYDVIVPKPLGMYNKASNGNVYPENMVWYDSSKNEHKIPRNKQDYSFALNSSNGNQWYGFDSYQTKSGYDAQSEENAIRTFTWPSFCKVVFKQFDKPTVNLENNKTLKWNISQTYYVQNGYDLYFDNVYYATTKNTYFDLPEKYRLGKHTFTVKVRPNSRTVNLGDYFAAYYDTPKGRMVDYTKETETAFIESSSTTISYNGKLSTPYINYNEKIAVNKYSVGWNSVELAEGYETLLDNNPISNVNRRVDATVHQGVHDITIIAYKNIEGIRYESEPVAIQFFMPKIDMPKNISFTKNLADGGSVFWSSVSDAEAAGNVKEYSILVNGIEYQTNGNTYTLESLPIGTNELKVKSNFGIDTTYNSEYQNYTFTDPNIIRKLSTPVLSATEIVNTTTKGVEALRLSWKPISYASGYVLDDYYEVYNDESGLWEGTHIQDDLIATEKIIKFNIGQGVGKHTYRVKAYYKELINDFTSDYSTTPEKGIIEVSKLKPITGLKWKSNNTGKHRDESTLLWNKVKDENYYRVFALKDGETGEIDSKGYVIKTNESEKNFSFDILNMSVVANQLTTANYDVYIRCYNYDTLYYQPSEISNRLIYDVIQLDPPTGLTFDNNTQTLSWNKVDMATSYIVYKVGEPNPIVETTDLYYDFPDLGAGFFKFYVIAKRTVMEEE